MICRGAILLLPMLLAGCAAKQAKIGGAYQFQRTPMQDLLIPPSAAKPGADSVIVLQLGKARLGKQRGGSCEVRLATFHLTWRKTSAELRVKTEDMVGGNRVALSLIDDIDTFRVALVKLEANGCLRPGEAAPLLTRMVEGLALPSRYAYYLRHGTSVTTGYVDVAAPFRLKVVAPIQRVGYETAWYGLLPRRNGFRLAPERVETSIQGKVIPAASPVHARIRMPDSLTFYRLFFLTRRSVTDHDILLLGAATKEALERSTEPIRRDGESACRTLQSTDVSCIQVPLDSAISAELRIKSPLGFLYVPVAGTLNDAFRAARLSRPAEVVKTLHILRPYGKTLLPVEFDRTKTDILSLVLIGGEELTWD